VQYTIPMLLIPAAEADYPEIVDLANQAYRGTGATASWNTETGILEGQRLNESLLRDDLATHPDGHLLTLREEPGTEILGTVRLDPGPEDVWHLGLLTVRPEEQKRHLGRSILAAAEDFARERGARRIHMSVLHVRASLIAWYERRGYLATGKTEPFPYHDERFGRPLREDLYFVVLEKDLIS
jgi:ribosomal protein S18 acetylase RimI-like enzyme